MYNVLHWLSVTSESLVKLQVHLKCYHRFFETQDIYTLYFSLSIQVLRNYSSLDGFNFILAGSTCQLSGLNTFSYIYFLTHSFFFIVT